MKVSKLAYSQKTSVVKQKKEHGFLKSRHLDSYFNFTPRTVITLGKLLSFFDFCFFICEVAGYLLCRVVVRLTEAALGFSSCCNKIP